MWRWSEFSSSQAVLLGDRLLVMFGTKLTNRLSTSVGRLVSTGGLEPTKGLSKLLHNSSWVPKLENVISEFEQSRPGHHSL